MTDASLARAIASVQEPKIPAGMVSQTGAWPPPPVQWFDEKPAGRFLDKLTADHSVAIRERREGRSQRRIKDFLQILVKDGKRWAVVTIYAGYVTDGFSLPKLLRWWQPDDPANQKPSLAHDFPYSTGYYKRGDIDRIFLALMRELDFAFHRRWAAYLAVRAKGYKFFGKPTDINLRVAEQARRAIFDAAGPGWPEEDALAFQPAGLTGFSSLLPEIMTNDGVEITLATDAAPDIASGLEFKRVKKWFKQRDLPLPNRNAVERLGLEQATKVYRDAWEQSKAGDMPVELAAAMFDGAAELGAPKMVKHLQRELKGRGLYADKIDGVPGALTRIAINRAFKLGAVREIAHAITERRAPQMKSLAPKSRRARLVRVASLLGRLALKTAI